MILAASSGFNLQSGNSVLIEGSQSSLASSTLRRILLAALLLLQVERGDYKLQAAVFTVYVDVVIELVIAVVHNLTPFSARSYKPRCFLTHSLANMQAQNRLAQAEVRMPRTRQFILCSNWICVQGAPQRTPCRQQILSGLVSRIPLSNRHLVCDRLIL